MSSPSFKALIESTNACSAQLYQYCQSQQWQECVPLLAQRDLLLKQLAELNHQLNQSEIEILGQLYQDILAKDREYLSQAELAHVEVKKQLRQIKRAEKNALPAYRKHS